MVLDYGKGKIDLFLLLGLVFVTPLLYEIFESLMFGNLCLTFYPGLTVVVCFVHVFLAFVSSWQGRFEYFGLGLR